MGVSMSCGQPPRHAASTRLGTSIPASTTGHFPESSISPSETARVESPVSQSDIGRIRTRLMRPAPECRVNSSAGAADPVRMNCPDRPRRSQAARTRCHRSGMRCHSSSRRGVAPSSSSPETCGAMSQRSGRSSKSISLRAKRCPVQVLPQALGPSMSTALAERNAPGTSASTTRSRYTRGGDTSDKTVVTGCLSRVRHNLSYTIREI